MSGRASTFSPANEPLFDPSPVRNPTRVNIGVPGGGGVSEWPFQFSWPGLVNALDVSPGVPTLQGLILSRFAITCIDWDSTSISGRIEVNGSTAYSFTKSANDLDDTLFYSINATDVVSIELTSIGTGTARGMWIGVGADAV